MGPRKVREGMVVSTSGAKTVTVEVKRSTRHPRYLKIVTLVKRYLAHDEKGNCRRGDRVLLAETRPRSARKRWRVVKILGRASTGGNER